MKLDALSLVRESCRKIHNEDKGELEHEQWTRPLKEAEIIQQGLILEVVIEGRQ